MLNFQNKSEVFSAENSGELARKRGSIYRKLLTMFLFCALCFTLAMPALVQAEDLEISEPLAGQSVRAAGGPVVDTISVGNKTISGDIKMGKGQRTHKNLTFTITVTVNRKAGGTEEKTVSIPPTERKTKWSVTLGSALAEGDKVTVTEVGETSKTITIEVQPSLKDQHKDDLKMPKGEIWIEQTSSNQVSTDEQAEAVQMLKDANTAIAGDIKSVEFSIDGTDHAYYEVTYTDGSTSGKVEATDLKIETVTDTSAAPTIQKVQVTDGQIIVTLDKEVAEGTKFYFVKNFTDGEDKNFSENGSCKVDKSTSDDMSQTVSKDGTTVTFPINDKVNDLKLGKEFGILVKEPHKFRSCAKSEPVITTPDKVAVRDPHKLTDADKKDIEKAIRDANTVNGTSKLPDGTGDWDGVPAVIQFDDNGNVKIFSGNDAEVTYDSNWNPVPVKNADGSVKVKDGAEPKGTIPAKDLVKNLKPNSPKIAVNTDDGKVTITPPAYEKPGDDTDLASYTITYKDNSGAEKTVTATRTVDEASGKTTWSADNATVDESTGVVNLEIKDFALGATVKAIATDKGGLIAEETPLNSEEQSQTLETAKVAYDRNGGNGDMAGKTLNKGVKYAILANIFTAPNENQEFKTWQIGDKEYAANDEFIVKADTVIKAIWKKIPVTVTYDGNGGQGTMEESKTLYKGDTYKVLASTFTAPENQEFDYWEIDGKKVAADTEITLTKDTVIKAIWKKIPVTVTYDGNGGSGEMKPATVDKGSTYNLVANGFTAPENQKFKGWKIGDTEYAPGDEITVNEDTKVEAVWEDIIVSVSYVANGGSGDTAGASMKKGSTYKLVANGFTAPENQKFKGWKIGDTEYAPGDEITVNEDTKVEAVWEDIPAPAPDAKGSTPGGNAAGKKGNSSLPKTGAEIAFSALASAILLASGGALTLNRKRRIER